MLTFNGRIGGATNDGKITGCSPSCTSYGAKLGELLMMANLWIHIHI